MNRRKDSFARNSSVSDIEELITIAKNQKEYHEDQIRVIRRRIELLDKSIVFLRDDFLSFLYSNGIDPNYPIIGEVTSDEIVPDTVPEQSMTAIPIESALRPTIVDNTFIATINLLRDKYTTLQDEIDEYVDNLKRKKLDKAKLEAKLNSVQKSIEEYKDKIKENRQVYNDSVKNLEKIKSLYQNILDFKYLFTAVPESFTSESYIKFQKNYIDRYSTLYYDKKRTIKKFADILQEEYKITEVDMVEQGFYTIVFRDISQYFGGAAYFGGSIDESLSPKYVDAISKKKEILDKLGVFSEALNKLILNVKISLDSIRGVKGVGNSVVEGLVTSTNEIAKSFAGEKRIEHTTLEDVSSNNYTINLGVNQKVDSIKNKLQLGVENLDETFMVYANKYLRKIALGLGFPVNFIYDRNSNLEDHVRDKVRQKFGGGIPFCDEETIIDSNGIKIFVKKSDIDPKTGEVKVDQETDILEKKTRTESSIMSV